VESASASHKTRIMTATKPSTPAAPSRTCSAVVRAVSREVEPSSPALLRASRAVELAPGLSIYLSQLTPIPATASAMTPVEIQPTVRSRPEMANRSITSRRATISIMTTITGTAITPLTTALQ
jgi:hypothetical protein